MSASTDRNLLFGILALQLDFIPRDALIGAMNAWVLTKDRPLGAILRDRGELSAERLRLLDALVAEHLRQHANDAQQSLASLSSVDPWVRGELRDFADPDVQASVVQVGAARNPLPSPGFAGEGPGARAEPDPLATAAQPLPPPGSIRYRILRPHAKGGLDEVFVAEDTELGRHVALKEIQIAHADHPDSRQRFVLEAEITGGLEHPGIVPVYGLGTYDDGRPFYAMRFVKGDNLRDALRRFHGSLPSPGFAGEGLGVKGSAKPALTPNPSPAKPGEGGKSVAPRFDSLEFRELLGRFVDVCQAVAYAHSRGVLHRDLKPGNVMLGKYGETLVVDWGLAKVRADRERGGPPDAYADTALHPRSGTDSAQTVMGQALGTPSYMSPEQAAGRLDQLGPATDIFSLGATLYELLTGRVAYLDCDLDTVQKGLFPPPRQLQPDVPRALEAICLKAMALRPEDRYGSALELAAEVQHWLADEPVTAYREPLAVHVRRWGRRHRPLVAGAAAVLVMAVVLLVVLNVHSERARLAVQREQEQTAAERDRAVAARNRTRESLDTMISEKAIGWLVTQKELLPQQRAFLDQVLTYYQQFAAEPADDELGRERLAKAHKRVGALQMGLGRQEQQAAAAYQRSTQLFEQLVADYPKAPENQLELAKTRRLWGTALGKMGRHGEAEALLRHSVELGKPLAASHPDEPKYQASLADSLDDLGSLLQDLDRRADAETAFRHANEIWNQLVAQQPGVPGYRHSLAASFRLLGDVLSLQARHAEAESAFRRCIELETRLTEDDPGVTVNREFLGQSLNALGQLLRRLARYSDAESAFRRSIEVGERLVAQEPGDPHHRDSLATCLNGLANLLSDLGRKEETVIIYRRCIEQFERLAADEPKMPRYRRVLAICNYNMAVRLRELGRREESERAFRQSIELGEHLSADYPNVPTYRGELAIFQEELGVVLRDMGRRAESEAAFRRSAELLKKVIVDQPGVALYRVHRAKALAYAGVHTEATAEADACAAAQGADIDTLASAATVFAVASASVHDDAALADRYGTRAVVLLRQAFVQGYADIAAMLNDPDLAPLRRRADYADLLWDLADTPAPPPAERR